MKRIFLLIAAFAAITGAQAQDVMTVHKNDGTTVVYNMADVNRVTFGYSEEPPVSTMEAVDLGLPSGIKWASCNLGANSPEEYGDYYAWGEVKPNKDDYSWSTYLTSLGGSMTSESDCGTTKDPLRDYVYGGSKYSEASKAGVADGIGGTEYDAAHVKLGGKWRMPSRAEQYELCNSCTWTWTTRNGVNGHVVTGPSGRSIFIPAVDHRYGSDFLADCGYWSSSAASTFAFNACFLYFDSGSRDWDAGVRCYGFTVRPVSE